MPSPAKTPELTPTPSPVPTPIQTPEPAHATIMLAGDLMCLKAQQNSALRDGAYDFIPSFAYVKDYFDQADYVIGNLETLVSPSHLLTRVIEQTNYPILNAPPEYLDALSYVGFDAVATVNNHCVDAGADGIRETLDQLNLYGIAHVGTNAASTDDRFVLADVNGVYVAVLAYSEIFNGKDYLLTDEEKTYMIHTYSSERVAEDVTTVKQLGADLVIAYIHWGRENEETPNETQAVHAQELADAGVDIIVGSHPHRLQKADYLQASDGRDVLCIYSMGNFVSSMAQQWHNETVIVRLNVTKSAGQTTLVDAGAYPFRVHNQLDGNGFVLQPANENTATRIAGIIGPTLPLLS